MVRPAASGARAVSIVLYASDWNADKWFVALGSCWTSHIPTVGIGQNGGDHIHWMVVYQV